MQVLFLKRSTWILFFIALFLPAPKASLGQSYECVSFFLLNNDAPSYKSQKFLFYPLTLLINNSCDEIIELKNFKKVISSKQNRGNDDIYWELFSLEDTVPDYVVITSVNRKGEISENLTVPQDTVLGITIYLDFRDVIYPEGYYRIVLSSFKNDKKLAETVISLHRK